MVNWDILNAGNRTDSGSGATTTGAAATDWGQNDLPLRQAHLVRLSPIRLHRSPYGHARASEHWSFNTPTSIKWAASESSGSSWHVAERIAAGHVANRRSNTAVLLRSECGSEGQTPYIVVGCAWV